MKKKSLSSLEDTIYVVFYWVKNKVHYTFYREEHFSLNINVLPFVIDFDYCRTQTNFTRGFNLKNYDDYNLVHWSLYIDLLFFW